MHPVLTAEGLRVQQTQGMDSRWERSEAQFRLLEEQEKARAAGATWPDGVLLRTGMDGDLVTTTPGQVSTDSGRFTRLTMTFRRRGPATYVRIEVEWRGEWDDYVEVGPSFDGSPISRAFPELSVAKVIDEATEASVLGWMDSYVEHFDDDDDADEEDHDNGIPSAGSLTVDGVDRVVHPLHLGSISYVGLIWGDRMSVEVVASGVNALSVARDLRQASSDEVAAFVTSHESEDHTWSSRWWDGHDEPD